MRKVVLIINGVMWSMGRDGLLPAEIYQDHNRTPHCIWEQLHNYFVGYKIEKHKKAYEEFIKKIGEKKIG